MDKIAHYSNKASQLKTERANFENYWQDVVNHMLPLGDDFTTTRTAGTRRDQLIFDSTPQRSLKLFASGIVGYMCNPADRWLEMEIINKPLMRQSRPVREWLQDATDEMYTVFNNAKANFYTKAHTTLMSVGGFGTGCLVDREMPNGDIVFTSYPLSQCYLGESAYGFVNMVYRKFKICKRQAPEMFGEDNLHKNVRESWRTKPLETIEVLHIVEPSDEAFEPGKYSRYPYYSCYIDLTNKHVMSEGGYWEFPYHVPRWYTLDNQVYGIGEGMDNLADARTLNAMMKTLLKAGQKAADPPLMAPDDGFLNKINQSAGAINYYNQTIASEGIKVIPTGANIPITMEMTDQKRQSINQGFHIDQFQDQKMAEMSATESLQRDEYRMRLLAPQIGRVGSELLVPVVWNVFRKLQRQGRIPDPPAELEGEVLVPQFKSPLVRAQRMMQIASVSRLFESLVPVANIMPEVFDPIDPDAYSQWLVKMHDAPHHFILSEQAVAEKRQKREADQQAMMQAQQAQQGADAVNKLAQAGALDAEVA